MFPNFGEPPCVTVPYRLEVHNQDHNPGLLQDSAFQSDGEGKFRVGFGGWDLEPRI